MFEHWTTSEVAGILVGLFVITIRTGYVIQARRPIPTGAAFIAKKGSQATKLPWYERIFRKEIKVKNTVVQKIAFEGLSAYSLTWVASQIALLYLSTKGLASLPDPWYGDPVNLIIVFLAAGIQIIVLVLQSFSSKF